MTSYKLRTVKVTIYIYFLFAALQQKMDILLFCHEIMKTVDDFDQKILFHCMPLHNWDFWTH